MLLPCDGECFFEIPFGLRYINFGRQQRYFPSYAINLCLMLDLSALFHFFERLENPLPSLVTMTEFGLGLSKTCQIPWGEPS